MLRVSFLLAALIAGASAVNVPTTYCDSAKDLINVPAKLTSNVWPPALGDQIELTLNGDVDDVILNTSFQINQEFMPVQTGETKMTFEVPKGAHSGTYSIDVHGRKNGREVYCVQAEWVLDSSAEERGTAELWKDVAKKIAELDLEREKMLKEAAANPPEDLPEFNLGYDPVEAHARMQATHDQVHALYPHMMASQREVEVEDPTEVDAGVQAAA